MGAHPCTPKTVKLGLTIEHWHALINKHEGNDISSSYPRRTALQCDIYNQCGLFSASAEFTEKNLISAQ